MEQSVSPIYGKEVGPISSRADPISIRECRAGAPKVMCTRSDKPDEEQHDDSSAEQQDEELASELRRALTPAEQPPSTSDEGGHECGWWAVVCVYTTRLLQARMHESTLLLELAAAIGLALKWPTRDVALIHDGAPSTP